MKSTQRADEVGSAGVKPGQLQRPLNGVGSVVDEETVLQITWSNLTQQFCQGASQGIEQFLAGERHALKLVGYRLDHLRMLNAGAINTVPTQAVNESSSQDILKITTLTDPFQGRFFPHFDHRLAIVQITAVIIKREILDCF